MMTSIEVVIDHAGPTGVMVKLHIQPRAFIYKAFVSADMWDPDGISIIVEEAKHAFMKFIFADVTPVITEIRTFPDAGCTFGDQEDRT